MSCSSAIQLEFVSRNWADTYQVVEVDEGETGKENAVQSTYLIDNNVNSNEL